MLRRPREAESARARSWSIRPSISQAILSTPLAAATSSAGGLVAKEVCTEAATSSARGSAGTAGRGGGACASVGPAVPKSSSTEPSPRVTACRGTLSRTELLRPKLTTEQELRAADSNSLLAIPSRVRRTPRKTTVPWKPRSSILMASSLLGRHVVLTLSVCGARGAGRVLAGLKSNSEQASSRTSWALAHASNRPATTSHARGGACAIRRPATSKTG
mmetsp:Transcript_46004/g.103914  ORF Transcript_46004/g.103914 Transcript_46004/m.103914 type:complete len:218 (-) Transcript_46004:38-691(-)